MSFELNADDVDESAQHPELLKCCVGILQRNMEKHLKSAIHLKHTRGTGRGSDDAKKINCGVNGCNYTSSDRSNLWRHRQKCLVYEGEYLNGMRHGRGTITSTYFKFATFLKDLLQF